MMRGKIFTLLFWECRGCLLSFFAVSKCSYEVLITINAPNAVASRCYLRAPCVSTSVDRKWFRGASGHARICVMRSARDVNQRSMSIVAVVFCLVMAQLLACDSRDAKTDDDSCRFCSAARSGPSVLAIAERMRGINRHNYQQLCAREFPEFEIDEGFYADGSLQYVTLVNEGEHSGEIWLAPDGTLMSIVLPWADAFYAPIFDYKGRLRAIHMYNASGIAVGPSIQIEPPLEIHESQIQWYDGGASQESASPINVNPSDE